MDLPTLPTGLVLFACAAAAAGVFALRLRRKAGSQAKAPATNATAATATKAIAATTTKATAAKAAASIDAPPKATCAAACVDSPGASALEALPARPFDGPGWAETQPMAGLDTEPPFADTMPAEMAFAPTSFLGEEPGAHGQHAEAERQGGNGGDV